MASLSVDGELSRFEQARLRRHLRCCSSCRAFQAELATVTVALRTSPFEKPLSRVELATRPRRAATIRPFLAAAAVAIAVLGLSGGLGGALPSEPRSKDIVPRLLAYYQLDLKQPAIAADGYNRGSAFESSLGASRGL